MKNIVMVMVCTVMGAFVLMITMSVTGRNNRNMEIKSNLSAAVEETVELLAEKKYKIADRAEYMADFIENMSRFLDSDSSIRVEVLAANQEKGLLSLLVTEEFSHPNGNSGSVSCERTVILDTLDEPEPEICQVRFYLTDDGSGSCYKSYHVLEDTYIAPPAVPQTEGATFAGWVDAGGQAADLSVPVTQDAEYYAVWM